MKIRIYSPSSSLANLGYPWSRHLNDWPDRCFVDVPCGIHRNVVKFIQYEDNIYVLKELRTHVAKKELANLHKLEALGLPVVNSVGLVEKRDEAVEEASNEYTQDSPKIKDMFDRGLLITKFLDGSLPYRVIIERGINYTRLEQMLDSLAQLLVRVHLVGFYWGDCSFSNALFKRDAGLLTAFLVDAETGEFHKKLSKGQREYDLELAHLNIAGDLMDLEAHCGLPNDADPVDLADSLVSKYHYFWGQLTDPIEIGANEQYKIDQFIERINTQGYDIGELEIDTLVRGTRLFVRPVNVEPGFNRKKLQKLTGLLVGENQAKRLLQDIYRYQPYLSGMKKQPVNIGSAARRWLIDIYQTSLDMIAVELRDHLDDAEVFHEILEHRWYISEQQKKDVGTIEATKSYVRLRLSLREIK
ncbi:MAG: DUF4032 domain-containing protein [Saccharospirillaceae bacterium]|nr:DUF4032 domain-containing protein [Pseudomonadales bacterium]NRB80023.1 DUF4032 domain-containing protein [Saccharospirillaceae bacterium]